MTRLTASEAQQQFPDALRKVTVDGERVLIHEDEQDVAVIISLEELNRLEAMEDEDDVRAALETMNETERIPYEEIRRELGLS